MCVCTYLVLSSHLLHLGAVVAGTLGVLRCDPDLETKLHSKRKIQRDKFTIKARMHANTYRCDPDLETKLHSKRKIQRDKFTIIARMHANTYLLACLHTRAYIHAHSPTKKHKICDPDLEGKFRSGISFSVGDGEILLHLVYKDGVVLFIYARVAHEQASVLVQSFGNLVWFEKIH